MKIIHTPLLRSAKPGGAGYYNNSRDWKHVDCKATGCKFNACEQCMVPSLCKIKPDGGCAGFEPKKLPDVKTGD